MIFSSVGELPHFVFERIRPVDDFFNFHRLAQQKAQIVHALIHVMQEFLLPLVRSPLDLVKLLSDAFKLLIDGIQWG